MSDSRKPYKEDPRRRRLTLYLSLLVIAALLAFQNPGQLWLAAGLLIALAADWLPRRGGKKPPEPEPFSTGNGEPEENRTAPQENGERKN